MEVKRYEIDAAQLGERQQAHAYLQELLGFPAYYGGNLDALYDCLRELPPAELHLDADALAKAGPYAQKVIQVLEEAARDDLRLHVILERRDPNMDQIETVYQQWLDQPDMAPALLEELRGMDEDTKYDSFYRDLEFGTAGLRGVLGAGTNRMNVYVVRRATQAVADYLNGTALPKCAAIGYDSRIGSDVFAREAAAVFAANGITAHLYPRLEPVPALSFAVRELHCGVGICITASHNPAQYNGYKVYGADGCQITPEAANVILQLIEKLDFFTSPKRADFDAALAAGTIAYIPDAVLEKFVDTVYAQRVGDGAGIAELKLVYTPLNGSGLECVRMLTKKLGIQNMTIVPEQEHPDGHFPTCPYPNPEIREAMQKGLELCDKVKPDILIGTDPDCDRCGAAVPDGKGGYRLISGNEMGVILLDFICRSRIATGRMPQNPVAVTTIVSTDMVDAVAKHYGVELRRVLTGFKFIGEQIALLEQAGHPERFIFGFEESYGYLSGTHVRDKDGVNAVLLICEAAAWYARKGMTLGDAIDALYAEYGHYRNGLCSFAFGGAEGMAKMQSLMDGLRADAPKTIGGLAVESVVDYEQDGTGLPKANVLEYRLAGGEKFIVRPSGTEPKIKTYLSALAPTAAEAAQEEAKLKAAAEEMMK